MFFIKQKEHCERSQTLHKPITTLKIIVKHVFEDKYKENKVLVEDYTR